MDPSILNDYGPAAAAVVLALLIVREVTAWQIRIRKETKMNGRFEKLAKGVEWLVEVHDHRDSDGVPVWYVRRSLELAIDKLADNVGQQTQIFQILANEIRGLKDEVKREHG